MAKLLDLGKRRAAGVSKGAHGAHKKCRGYCDQRNGITELPDYRQSRWMELVFMFLITLYYRSHANHIHGRDYGSTRGYPNESEFTYVKVRSTFYSQFCSVLV